jgi:hypothetical protein
MLFRNLLLVVLACGLRVFYILPRAKVDVLLQC